ncbi:MAG: phage major capsid protein [Chloroflexi bacterium]|nr:MAG: phage major capsid protein [Chloroflexota bacterium]
MTQQYTHHIRSANSNNAVGIDEREGQYYVQGYLVYFEEDLEDAYGNRFTAETDFMTDTYDIVGVPVIYEHSFAIDEGKNPRASIIGEVVDYTIDDRGVHIVARLYDNPFNAILVEKIKSGELYWSSGTISHLARTEPPEHEVITVWPIVEATLTANPAAPRGTNTQLLVEYYRSSEQRGKASMLCAFLEHQGSESENTMNENTQEQPKRIVITDEHRKFFREHFVQKQHAAFNWLTSAFRASTEDALPEDIQEDAMFDELFESVYQKFIEVFAERFNLSTEEAQRAVDTMIEAQALVQLQRETEAGEEGVVRMEDDLPDEEEREEDAQRNSTSSSVSKLRPPIRHAVKRHQRSGDNVQLVRPTGIMALKDLLRASYHGNGDKIEQHNLAVKRYWAQVNATRSRRLDMDDPLHPYRSFDAQMIVPPDAGGALLEPYLYEEIMRYRYDLEVISPLLRKLVTVNPSVDIPIQADRVRAHFVGELQRPASSVINFNRKTVVPQQMRAEVMVSEEMILSDTNYGIEQFIIEDMTQAMVETMEQTIVRGDGTGGSPLGLTKYSGVHQETVATITRAKLLEAVNRLYENRTVAPDRWAWVMNSRSMLYLQQLEDAAGQLIYAGDNPNYSQATMGGRVNTLLGLPVYITENANATGEIEKGTIILGYWNDGLLVERPGMTVRATRSGQYEVMGAVVIHARHWFGFIPLYDTSFVVYKGITGA